MRIIFISFILLGNLNAKDFYTILDYALKHSPIINIADIDAKSANYNYDFYKSYLYPELSIGANHTNTKNDTYNKESFENYNNRQNSVSLLLKYDIFKFGADYYKLKSAKENSLTAKYNKCYQELKLSLDLLDYYEQGLIIKNQIDIYKDLKFAYENLYNTSQQLNKAGEIDKVSVNLYFLDFNNIKTEILKLELEFNNLLSHISYLSGLNIKKLNNLNTDIVKQISLDFLKFEKTNKYLELKSKLKANEYDIKSLQKQKYPTINIYARYDIYEKTKNGYTYYKNKTNKRHGYEVGIGFNYVIFDGNRINSQIHIKELESKKIEQEIFQESLAYKKLIDELIFFIDNKNEIISTLKTINKESSKHKKIMKNLHKSGEKTKLDVIDSSIENLKKLQDLNEYVIKSHANMIRVNLINNQNSSCVEN